MTSLLQQNWAVKCSTASEHEIALQERFERAVSNFLNMLKTTVASKSVGQGEKYQLS